MRYIPVRAPSAHLRTLPLVVAAALCSAPLAAQHTHEHPPTPQPAQPPTTRPAPPTVSNSVAIDFSFGPTGRAPGTAGAVRERESGEIRMRITDRTTGRPITGLHPLAWVDVRTASGAEACQQKVGAFTEGTLHVKHGQINVRQPVDDLNGHYVAVLARSPHVAVLDPVKGFGRTRMLTAVPLPAPGADWAATSDDRRLFVTIPDSGTVAVINTLTWRMERLVKTGSRPDRAARAPDGRIWVSDAAGVLVMDPRTLEVASRAPVGAGPHTLAFSHDGRWAFVAARGAGTVTVLDAATGAAVRQVKTGPAPAALAWSSARSALFVADETDGSVSVVDPAKDAPVERIAFRPGIRSLRFAPEASEEHAGHGAQPVKNAERLLFVLNPGAGELSIYDVAERRVVRTLSGAPEPDQVAFSPSFAYVRAAGTASVALVPLNEPTSGAMGPHDYFPAGGGAPGAVGNGALGDVMVPAPGMHDALYVANPRERMVYLFHYMEGMPVPHGGVTTYTFEPRAIRTVARGMRETAPGVYEATVSLDRSGDYELVMRIEEPYWLGCQPFTVVPDPAMHKADAVRIETVGEPVLRTGSNKVLIRVTRAVSGSPVPALEDLGVQLASPAGWQRRLTGKALGDGTYEVSVDVPEEGIVYLSFEIPSQGVRLRDRAPITFRTTGAANGAR